MPAASADLTRFLRLIAAGVSIIVAVSLPLGYWMVVYSFTAEAASDDAAAHAQLVTQRIAADPGLWRFEISRLGAIAATHFTASGFPEEHYVLDERGAVLAQSAARISAPTLTRFAPLFDSGMVVGRFVTSRSLLPALQNTALVALFGLLLASAVYVSMSLLPLRALTRVVSESTRAAQALHDSAEKLRLFSDNVSAMTVSYDESRCCLFANKGFAEFFGFAVENILGKHLREVVGADMQREMAEHFAQVLQGHPVTYQSTRKLQNGEIRHLEIKLLPQFGDQGKVLGCFAVMTDITEHKLAEERIQRVAHHDSLTGLANRLLFNDRLDQAISFAKRDSRQFALLYLDLDKFKPVNDSLGHTAGDELLRDVATRIRFQVRESDTVARVGGDEFTVILPDIASGKDAETVAKKIIAAIAAPFQLGSRNEGVSIGTSIGIALYPTDARDADALVKAADAAMYCAKQVGNSFQFCAKPLGNATSA